MSLQRNFTFPISTLVRDAKLLLGALRDAQHGPPVIARLKEGYDAAFAEQIRLVEKGGTDQSGAIGTLGNLTEAQTVAVGELERLMSGARRSAGLAFPQNDVRLRSEFQVGVHEPGGLGSELERAEKIRAACVVHADALAEHGWIAADTTALADAIALLSDGDEDQENAKKRKLGLTTARTVAANALYRQCLSVQNAARLAYPGTKAANDATVVEARGRYLLDEFPPRGGASAGVNPDPHGPAPSTPPTPPIGG